MTHVFPGLVTSREPDRPPSPGLWGLYLPPSALGKGRLPSPGSRLSGGQGSWVGGGWAPAEMWEKQPSPRPPAPKTGHFLLPGSQGKVLWSRGHLGGGWT